MELQGRRKSMGNQAKKGGEYGINGSFYEGGQFLPKSETTEKGKTKFSKSGEKKIETAPYLWLKTPNITLEKTNDYKEIIVGFFRNIPAVFNHDSKSWIFSDTCDFYRVHSQHMTPEALNSLYSEMNEAWNAGLRFIKRRIYNDGTFANICYF